MRYESEVLYDLMKRDGLLNPSQEQLPYESELKEKYVDEVKGAYPKVTDYRPEWLNYNLGYYIPADFPTESLVNVTAGTINNVIPYAYKSAILKGQTLMNLTKGVYGNGKINTQYANTATIKLELLKPSTKYIAYVFNDGEEDVELYWNSTANFQWGTFVCKSKAMSYSIGASKANFNDNDLIFSVQTSQTLPQSLRCVILEYIEGMENWDIPYFEGMQSVKMPVLRTVGKNLFDGELELGAISGGINRNWKEYFRSKNFIPIKPNTAYGLPNQILIDNTLYNGKYELNFYDNDKKYISTVIDKTCTTPPNAKFMRICYFVKQNFTVTLDMLNGTQIYLYENGTTNDEFEPYKSNILSCNEEVELRGIGEVKDELNVATGELTQRIGEVVIDGSEQHWGLNAPWSGDGTDYCCFYNSEIAKGNIVKVLGSDKLAIKSINELKDGTTNLAISEGIRNNIANIQIFLSKSKLTTVDVDGFKQYLQSNPITIQYELATESIKTVDLTSVNQDGVPSTFRPFEGTMHVETDGEPLKPLLYMEIPVEATTQNLASFVNLEGVERTVNEYVDEEIVGDDNDEQLL